MKSIFYKYRIFLLFIFFLLYAYFFTVAPYLSISSYTASDPELFYTGAYGYPGDAGAYFEQMTPEARSGLLKNNYYTPEPHQAILTNTFYVMLGYIAENFHISVPITLLIARILVGILAIILFYILTKKLTGSKQIASWGLAFLLFAGGLSLLTKVLFNSPLFQHIETIPGIRLFGQPHITLSSLLLFILVGFLSIKKVVRPLAYFKLSLICGFIVFTISLLLPFLSIVGVLIFLVYSFYSSIKNKLGRLPTLLSFILFTAISFSYVGYLYLVTRQDQIWNYKFDIASSSMPTLNIVDIVLGFSVFALFAIFEIRSDLIKNKTLRLLLYAWIIISFFLSMISPKVGIRFIEGVSFPLSALAATGFIFFLKTKKLQVFGKFIFIVIALFITVIASFQTYALHKIFSEDLKTINQEVADNLSWVRSNTTKNTVLVGNSWEVVYFPYLSGRKVYAGHWAETYDVTNKIEVLNSISNDYQLHPSLTNLLNDYPVCFLLDNKISKEISGSVQHDEYYYQKGRDSSVLCEHETLLNTTNQ